MKKTIICWILGFWLILSNAWAAPWQEITQEDFVARQSDAKWLVLDVRSEGEYASGHVPGAINIPFDEVVSRKGELASSKEQGLVVYCRSGRRASIALEALKNEGFDHLIHLSGDMMEWETENRPIEKGK